ncbi:hypothetical protein KFK09_002804 [Dendrobium nobile]|uniref:Uncharacterized protein n=1 Tax=Dendrobium nobile TaxID=94219 RepID=A0A8T3C5X3_DENNO|nr:hypothetical protein KFK09_002804 [Dendrobium nobile]
MINELDDALIMYRVLINLRVDDYDIEVKYDKDGDVIRLSKLGHGSGLGPTWN